MIEPTVVEPRHGEVIGDSPERRVEILSDHDALHATLSRLGPHVDGADLHVHYRHADLFYVLEGELTVRLGPQGAGVRVPAGTLARIPPGVVHGFRSASDADVRYLNLPAPGVGFNDYLRALRDGRTLVYDQEPPPADGGRPATDATIGGDGFELDRPGRHVRLLADTDELGLAEVRSDPGDPPVPHAHRDRVESFYVLAGELALTIGDRDVHAQPGTWAQVPPGTPRTVSSRGPARFLDVHTPARGFGALMRDGGEQ